MTHPGQLLKENKLYAGKELGQNFLSDPNTARIIVEKTGISKETHVLEVGPGLGALTIHIAKSTPNITVVEKDFRIIPLLEQELATQNLEHVNIINKDILKVDLKELAGDKKLVVIGNLPYNISSQILFKLVEDRSVIKEAFLMFQKELATRIISSPGGRDYSRLSAVVQYACEINWVSNVGPSAFFPRPDVDSSILNFKFSKPTEFNAEQERFLFQIIKSAFSKRRKSLKNSMVGGDLDLKKEFIIKALDSAGIEPKRRAETLTVEEFKSLAQAVWDTY